MCSLVISLFSLDYSKTELNNQQWFNLPTSVQYSHSAWFLDGKEHQHLLCIIVQ